jgi:cation diffusion facilitator CzcD-associated flavoprotein CzcO
MKICVIGAGPSGLTTVKQLLDEGHTVQCFERGSDIGGIWQRSADPSADAEDMKVFDSLILTISIKLMSYSDFMVTGDRVFYTHAQYRQYLDDYAEKFGLRRHIALDTRVEEVKKEEGGRWAVTVSSKGSRETTVFDAVAVCSGPFQTPETKSVPDLDQFSGEVVHSSTYRHNRRFAGKRVMVVGLAESGADLAREVSDVASACTLSIRSRSFLIPRMHNGEFATDATATRVLVYDHFVRSVRQRYPLPSLHGDGALERAAFHTLAWTYRLTVDAFDHVAARLRRFIRPPAARRERNIMGEPADPTKLDIGCEWTREHVEAINEWNKRSHDLRSNWSQRIIFSKNVSFIPNIVNGKLRVNDSGVERISGNRVFFKDGHAADFDAIVLCTGFKKDFSALGQDLAVKDNNVRNLYKHAFHPDHDGTLAFIGFVRPYTGGIPIVAEMQARYFALLCSGKHRLPADLDARIAREKAWEDEMVALSPRHPETIPSQQMFLDGIAKEIGCLLPLSKLMFEPRLLVRHWFYPFNQACYRLTGPHSDAESARRELLSDAEGPGDVFSLAILLLPLLFCPSFVHPKYVLFDLPKRKAGR